MENIIGLAKNKGKNMENPSLANDRVKSQEELREILENKLYSLKPVIMEERDKYVEALNNGTFEDEDNEEIGSGDKRKEEMQKKIMVIVDRAKEMKRKLDDKEILPQITPEIQTTFTYTNPDTKQIELQENITLNIEDKLEEYEAFYQKHQIDLPPNFADTIKDIWEKNYDEIQKEIETNGFNEILLMPANLSLPDLHTEMTAGYNDTYQSENFKQGGSFAGAKSTNTDKIRLVLVHNAQTLKDHPILKKTLNTYGKDVDQNHTLTLEDYLVHQRKYEEANPGKHLDVDGWTWLATYSGARLVSAHWYPGGAGLDVLADGLEVRDSALGVRTSRSFFN